MAELAAIHASKPRTKDVMERFAHRITPDPVGTGFTVNLQTHAEVKEFSSMRDEYRRRALARGRKLQGKIDRVKMLVPKTGEVREVPTSVASAAEGNGMRLASLPSMTLFGNLERLLDEQFCPRCELRHSWCRCWGGE